MSHLGERLMKLLILGGTIFVGRHIVEAALAAGHEVTLLNRGRSGQELFPSLERLTCDRDGDLAVLQRGRSWDAVIDVCGYFPRQVKAMASALGDSVSHYTFISSVSVYDDFSQEGLHEGCAVASLPEGAKEEITGETYGAYKALCESALEEALPGRVLNVRPGLVAGPHDSSDRFTYWVRRIDQGGDVLCPGDAERNVQFIDARDLASWVVKLVERGTTGTYNAVGPDPDQPLSMSALLEACCKAASGSGAHLVWVSDEILEKSEVVPWMELPLWLPAGHEKRGICSADNSKALSEGLCFRSVYDTVNDTLIWDRSRRNGEPLKAGLAPEKEAEILLSADRLS